MNQEHQDQFGSAPDRAPRRPPSKKRSIPERSVEVEFTVRLLEKVEVGQTIGYDRISAEVGFEIRAKRSVLASARKILINEKRILFGAVPNVGVQRLTDVGVIDSGEGEVSRIRRAAKRASRKMLCVQNYEKLSDVDKTRHNAQMTVLHVAAHVAARPNVARIAAIVDKEKKDLPPALALIEYLKSR